MESDQAVGSIYNNDDCTCTIVRTYRRERMGDIIGKEGGKLAITGRQPPPLSSVLYRIIHKRRSVVVAQVLLREK